MYLKRRSSLAVIVVLSWVAITGCKADTTTPIRVQPNVVEVFACSDYCPGPKEQYIKRVYEGVTDEEACRALGGQPYTYIGWGEHKVCEVKTSGAGAHGQLENSAAIDEFLEQAVLTTRIPGLVALVVDSDEVLYHASFGYQDVAAEIPMSMSTVFNIASMTKPVAATAIMMMIEEGELDLDDPISRYAPDFVGKTVLSTFSEESGTYTTHPAAREITVRDLMSHSSGLAYGFSNVLVYRLNGGRPFADNSGFPLLFDPGTAWSYGTGIGVVAKVVEEISGQSLDDILSARIFEPLGMFDTAYVVPADKTRRVATVHRMTGTGLSETPVPDEVRSRVSGNGGLYSTAGDYARFIQLFLNDGVGPDGRRLLSANSIRIMGENQLGDIRVSLQDAPAPSIARAFPLGAGRDGFGIGFQVTGAHEDARIRSPGSLSWAGLFNTQFWIDRQAGIGAVLLMQYLPFYDEAAIATLSGFEQRVYATR